MSIFVVLHCRGWVMREYICSTPLRGVMREYICSTPLQGVGYEGVYL